MHIFQPPPIAGYLQIAEGVSVACQGKPNRLHRLMMRFLLGWEWKDKA